jgi:PASTA domain-containing protein
MRVSSSRAATTAALVAGLAVLVVAGRLLPTTPSAPRPATPASAGATAGTVETVPLRDVTTSTVEGVRVPNAIGRTLAKATSTMRAAGLQGAAFERDPQIGTAVVVAQEPPAGELIPPSSVVGFRTRTDVQANGSPHRSWLGPGPTNDIYRVVAPYAVRQQLTVVVTAPRGIDVQVWLESGLGKRLPVLDSTRDATSCHPTGGRSRCVVRFGALQGQEPGGWTVSLAKQSFAPAAIQVAVTFTPL